MRHDGPEQRQRTETCWTVVRAASSGDAAARALFVRSYSDAIRGFLEARWRGRVLSTQVQDATQEVFLACLEPGGVLARADPARGEFHGLLFGVARNIARRFEQQSIALGRIRQEDSAWVHQVAADEAGQATLFDRSWARSLVRLARRRYRALALAGGEASRQRFELLERRFRDDRSIRAIAAEWGVPTQAVHQAYRTARSEFYRCLREVVAQQSPPGADLDCECRRLLSLVR